MFPLWLLVWVFGYELRQVSILFIEVFPLWHPVLSGYKSDPGFQSSLLRCFHCDGKIETVRLLLIEFQSSLLRCFHCDFGRRQLWSCGASRFNPLYWGVSIVTLADDRFGDEYSEVSILFIEVFPLWRLTATSIRYGWQTVSILFIEVFPLWRRQTEPHSTPLERRFNPLYWGVSIVTRGPHRDLGTLHCFNPLYWGVSIVTRVSQTLP